MCSKCHWTILSQRSCVRGERREIECAEGSSRHSVLSNSKRRTAINTKSLHRPAPRSVASHEDGLISSFGNPNGKEGVSSSPVSAKSDSHECPPGTGSLWRSWRWWESAYLQDSSHDTNNP